VQPATQIALAGRVREAGGVYVECAVSGTTGPARQGRLIGLAGGEPDDVARARPVLGQLCRRLEHCGPIGAGASVKLAVNLPLAVYWQALGEAYALCRGLGRDPAWLVDLLADTSGGPNVLKVRGQAVAEALAGGDPAPTFDVDGVRKDLRTMIAEAGALGVRLPVAEAALRVYDEADAQGWGRRDATALAAYWPGRHGAGRRNG
jgi:3-hydroxyisobutyrate dehydrogenase